MKKSKRFIPKKYFLNFTYCEKKLSWVFVVVVITSFDTVQYNFNLFLLGGVLASL